MTAPGRISSRQHPVVREFRRVAARTGADTGTAVLLDGEHLLQEALASRVPVRTVLADDRHADALRDAAAAGAAVFACTRAVLDAASPVRTPSGLVALADWSPASLDTVFSAQPALVIGLVDVQDPGNVGSAIRSADALGATGLVAIGATADPSGWKVLRGSMGSAFRLPLARAELADAEAAARRSGSSILATTRDAGRALGNTDLTAASFVLFGHEGLGLSAEVVSGADLAVSIRMRPGVDSLNVAVAAALVLDEARRQRERPQ